MPTCFSPRSPIAANCSLSNCSLSNCPLLTFPNLTGPTISLAPRRAGHFFHIDSYSILKMACHHHPVFVLSMLPIWAVGFCSADTECERRGRVREPSLSAKFLRQAQNDVFASLQAHCARSGIEQSRPASPVLDSYFSVCSTLSETSRQGGGMSVERKRRFPPIA